MTRALDADRIDGAASMAGVACEEIFCPRSMNMQASDSDTRGAIAWAKAELGPAPKATGVPDPRDRLVCWLNLDFAGRGAFWGV